MGDIMTEVTLIQCLKIIYNNYNIDLEDVRNTGLWELEENIGADHFRISKTRGDRTGYQPLKKLTKEEIVKLDSLLIGA